MNSIKKSRNSVLFLKGFVLFLLLFSFATGCGNATQNGSYKNINAKQAFELIQNEKILILDVRTPGEYAQGHIKNSILIPVQVLHTEYKKIESFRTKKVIIYCRSGNRSVTASNVLLKNGFTFLYNMTGGIKDWAKNSLPIQTTH